MAITGFAGPLWLGEAYKQSVHTTGSIRGAAVPHIHVEEYGAVLVASSAMILASTAFATNSNTNLLGTSTAAFSTSGIVATSGVTVDVPRCITVSSTGAMATGSFTFTGTDKWGDSLTETFTGPTNSTVTTQKAFKTITSMTYSATTATGVNFRVGLSDDLGLPYYASNAGKVLGVAVSGKSTSATGVSFTAPLTATGTSTATTADVHGILSVEAIDGSSYITVMVKVDPTSKATLFGADQYSA